MRPASLAKKSRDHLRLRKRISAHQFRYKPMTHIRRATSGEAEILTQIAHDAKRYWGYPESWVERWKDDLTLTPDFISSNEVYVVEADSDLAAESESGIAGFYAIAMSGEKAELEHMWVRPERIGSGCGKELMMHALETAAFLNAAALEISADPNAEGFYKRMGATRIGETQSEIEGQPRTLPRLAIELDRS
jgi:GNAT superfamily N-acetyltransferase